MDTVPLPDGAYSQAVWLGPLLFTAGMRPIDTPTGRVIGKTIRVQTMRTMKNLERLLTACGLEFGCVVRSTVHLADIDRDFAVFDEVYRSFFQAPLPARTTVGSNLGGVLVEIDLIAARGASR